MSTNGETADLMVREGIQITESALKLAGLGAKNLAALLIALANDNQKLAGKTNLKRLIHDGEELTIFPDKVVFSVPPASGCPTPAHGCAAPAPLR